MSKLKIALLVATVAVNVTPKVMDALSDSSDGGKKLTPVEIADIVYFLVIDLIPELAPEQAQLAELVADEVHAAILKVLE